MNSDKHYVAELAKGELTRLWDQVDNLNKRIDYQRRLITENCQHVDFSVRTKYNSGGYDHVSSVHITHTCDLCGKILKAYDDPHHHGTYE